MRRGFGHITEQFQYEEYRRRLDARAVLDHYGVENDYEVEGSDGTTEVVHSCLLDHVERHHNNGDASPSASCNLDFKLYICHSYWGGDLFHFIMKMEGKESFDGILDTVGGFLGEATQGQESFRDGLDRVFAAAERPAYSQELPAYSDRVLAPWSFVHPYLAERGIDVDTASRLHVGWREDDNRITIPHFWEGKLVGWQARAVPDRPGHWPGTGGTGPKYRSSSGFPKSDTLYTGDGRGHLRSGPGIVVESPFSVLRAAALQLSTPVVATFGAKVSDRQLGLLKNFSPLYVWMDDDAPGRAATYKIVRGLQYHTRVMVIDPDPGLDLGDYETAESVQAKIDSALPAVRWLSDLKE